LYYEELNKIQEDVEYSTEIDEEQDDWEFSDSPAEEIVRS